MRYNFDDMFTKLQAFKSKNGHCNVPKNTMKMQGWALGLTHCGLEYEDPGNRKLTSRTLVKECIDMLEELGFEWVRIQQRATWEEYFDNMIEYYQTHGIWPPKNLGRPGEWTIDQRKL
ncbi:hypothetical protein ACHAWO_007706 [Cyclotella atomus]|uniref:Helicase-associated domain-containing protein n=1 Tax=Cyclotella atomus TaxID=382360 RepID=A0ABD3Q404_9STRA